MSEVNTVTITLGDFLSMQSDLKQCREQLDVLLKAEGNVFVESFGNYWGSKPSYYILNPDEATKLMTKMANTESKFESAFRMLLDKKIPLSFGNLTVKDILKHDERFNEVLKR